MKKQIDMLTQLLEKNGISFPDSSKRREGGSSSEDKERVHALVAGTSSSPSFIIDSGASRHMVFVNTIIYQRGERPWRRRKIMVVWILWLKDI